MIWKILAGVYCVLIFKQNAEYKLELLHHEEGYPGAKEYSHFMS